MDIAQQANESERNSRSNIVQHQEAAAPVSEESPLLRHRDSGESIDENELLVNYSENRKTVRSLKFVLSASIIVELAWVLVLAANTALGGLLDHGDVFLQIDLALFVILNSWVTLRFFEVWPTVVDVIFATATAACILVVGLLVALVPHLRRRHASTWVLMAALLVDAIFTVIAALSVHTVRRIFITNRPEERPPQKWWIVSETVAFILRVAVAVLAVLLAGTSFLAIFNYQFPEGSLVPVGRNQFVHIYCSDLVPSGDNTTVLLESEDWTPSSDFAQWAIEATNNAGRGIGRVCYWDRPGTGHSDAAPSPQSAGTVADALTQVLNHLKINDDQLFLVSHGNGGIYSRVFASRHRSRVSSIMLIDTPDEEYYVNRLGFISCLKVWVKGLILPWTNGFSAALQQHYTKELTKQEVKASNEIIRPNTPVAVVSASRSLREKSWSEGQRLLAKSFENTVAWEIIEGPHELWRVPSAKAKLQSILIDMGAYF